MKSLFNQAEYIQIRSRLEKLSSSAMRQWGKMDAAQMLAHCNEGLKHVLGKVHIEDKSNFIMRTLVKSIVLRAIKKGDLGKSQKTAPAFVITDTRNFDQEKQAVLQSLDELYLKAGHMKFARHPFFGHFTKDQWGGLQYAHLDHHLRQFSA